MVGDRKTIGSAMVVSGVLITMTGALHPRPKGDTVNEAAVGMIGADGWVISHLPQAAGMAVLVVVALLIRRWPEATPTLRRVAAFTAVGAGLAVVESVPHMLATTEAAELAAGGATPLYDLHMWLQAVATPAAGFGVAALAWVGSRDGGLGPRPLAWVGVIGGIGFGLAGPAVLLTESMLLARLFMLTAAVALWLVVTGALVVRAERAPSVGRAAEVR